MPSGASITKIDFNKLIDGNIQDFTIKVAEQTLSDAVAKGFDSSPIVITDGATNRDWRLVKPYGTIEFARQPVMKDCVVWITAELIRRAPVLTGRYKLSFAVLVNGEQVQPEALDTLKPTDRVQIVNTQPYAKKLEGDRAVRSAKLKKGRGSIAQASGGIFQPVQRAAVAKFGRTIFIDFLYVPLNLGQTVMRRRGTDKHGSYKLRTPHRVSAVYPCIQLRIAQLM